MRTKLFVFASIETSVSREFIARLQFSVNSRDVFGRFAVRLSKIARK